MCGFCGVAFLSGVGHVNTSLLTTMRDTMVHRGPDGAGLWLSPDARVGLAHRRLAIIDPTPESAQPMASETDSIQVVFNGEIYNHASLRAALVSAGHRFKTDHSDTEVLLHGYEQWGMDGLLQRLKGMFAFALWDADRRQLFLVRDRLGIKPLYWTVASGALMFGSEIKALLASPTVPRTIQPQAMYHYLSGMVTPAPLTMFKGVYKLPAAHVLRFDEGGGSRAWTYWDPLPERPPQHADRQDLEHMLRERLESSVREHLVSDVSVGLFLSGGVDSSSILAAMAGAGQKEIQAFSVGFKDWTRLNELEPAREVAQHFGAHHHEILIDESDMRATLDDVFWSQDEPLADWVCVPLFHVAALAASQVKVVMVGEGADEPFAGYDGYRDFLRVYRGPWSAFGRLPRWLQSISANTAERMSALRWDWAVAADFGRRAALDQDIFWSGAMTFWETQKHLLLNMQALPALSPEAMPEGLSVPAPGYDTFQVMRRFRDHLRSHGAADDVLGRMIYYELKYRLPELLLMRVDKMTMAHSLEARVPFLDHELVELAMRIPSAWKVENGVGKSILKSAVRNLIPDAVIDRPKMGFGAPMAEWLRGDFGHELEQSMLQSDLFRTGWFRPGVVKQLFAHHRHGGRNNAHYIWTLCNLTAWHQRWLDAPAMAKA